MSKSFQYAGICIIDGSQQNEITMETISVTPESCDLAGAWDYPSHELESIKAIAIGKLIIFLGDEDVKKKVLGDFSKNELSIQDFLNEARNDAEQAIRLHDEFMKKNLAEYAEYMKIKPLERKLIPVVKKKNLIVPEFSNWPTSVDLSDALTTFRSWNKLAEIKNTPPNMVKVLTASRLLKALIDMWRFDEIERTNRLYLNEQHSEISILPRSWMSKLESL
jgi:hypothetical protein